MLISIAEPADALRHAVERGGTTMKKPGGGFTLLDFVLVVVVLGFLAVLLFSLLGRRAGPRPSCVNNLKQMGIVFKMYANEWNGRYPQKTPYAGVWMVDPRAIYPEYLVDLSILTCPEWLNHDELAQRIRAATDYPVDWELLSRLTAESYTYTNWMVMNDDDVRKLSERYPQLTGEDYDEDIPRLDAVADEGNEPDATARPAFHRLREGIERFLITDITNPAASALAQSTIPVMFDNICDEVFSHEPPGCNVLYMDGHVAFRGFGDSFPATETVAQMWPVGGD
jgi:prepilin-type processing-associated H-X9-DG protein